MGNRQTITTKQVKKLSPPVALPGAGGNLMMTRIIILVDLFDLPS